MMIRRHMTVMYFTDWLVPHSKRLGVPTIVVRVVKNTETCVTGNDNIRKTYIRGFEGTV